MADQKRPTTTTTQRLPAAKPDDFVEADVTVPGAPFRTAPIPPRIATPLGGLKPPPKGLPMPGVKPAPVVQQQQPAPAPPAPAPQPPAPEPPGHTTEAGEVVRVHNLARPDKLDPRLFLARAPDAPVAASFRVLRHRIVEKGTRVIAVTSPGRGEGKSTVAANLALALGESGRARVLLLEANLRHPSLATMFGFLPPVCFGEQLEMHRTHPMQPWIVVENVSPHLHTAAVSPHAHPRALVDGPAVAIALDQLRGTDYGFIVIDCPPVLGSADVNLLAEHVDGVLIAMWRKRSRARALRRAVEQIGGGKVIGSALVG